MAPKWIPDPNYDGKGLKESDAIKLLVGDPGRVPDLVMLRGLMGQSATNDVWRIYVTWDLSEYYEVHAKDVKLVEHDSGTVKAWVDRSGIRHLRQRPWSPEVESLTGRLAAQASSQQIVGFGGPDEGFGPEPTKCINGCATGTR